MSFVQKFLRPGKASIVSKSYCPACLQAKQILKDLKINFDIVTVDQEDIDESDIQKFHELSKIKTYPKIFFGLYSIGGCSDLKQLIQDGKIQKIIDQENIKQG